jgi:type IV secretory pathway TraG/TraD family ATPase VirD4
MNEQQTPKTIVDPGGRLAAHDEAAALTLDPFGCNANPLHRSIGFNPLDVLAHDDPAILTTAASLAKQIIPDQSRAEAYWTDTARQFLAGFIASVRWRGTPPEPGHLGTVRTWVTENRLDMLPPELERKARGIQRKSDKQWLGIHSTLIGDIEFLNSPALLEHLKRSTDPGVLDGRVFVCFPESQSARVDPWVRLVAEVRTPGRYKLNHP